MRRQFKNQIGNPNAFNWKEVMQDFATYGTRKCSDGGPTMCKCDCNLDGIEEFVMPLPYEAMGNWIPNYPQPTSLLQAAIIDHLCCYNACNGECFGDQEGLTGSDGVTPIDTGSTGGVKPPTPPVKPFRKQSGSCSTSWGGLKVR